MLQTILLFDLTQVAKFCCQKLQEIALNRNLRVDLKFWEEVLLFAIGLLHLDY